ncbi:MAG: hypothetical protein HXS41_13170 [Theionarchaea archaeon]|nr:hypothetical protein [Theionarchaea archaeon]MBU7000614.1 hypothetical protein [Theionarchaea archaeon]MBU7022003.1 hypothetical protein [Theionarchaea archaeon]MBU7035956.1 hypothetical protein [Theionarchaea archaeon]MBU7041775.1 hypothetical protein [Theionarchaea archaeon]
MYAALISDGIEGNPAPLGSCINGDGPEYGFYCFNLGITPTGGGKCKYGLQSMNE